MSESTVFARVFPKSIKVTEKYNYRADLTGTFHVEEIPAEADKPNGAIEILIPYDGEKYFSNQSIGDIKRQNAQLLKQNEALIRFGYLSFAEYDGLHLEDNLGLKLQHHVASLDLPVRDQTLKTMDQLTGHFYAGKIKYTYQPKLPDIPPIKIRATLSDESSLTKLEGVWDLLAKPQLTSEQEKKVEEAARSLAQQEGFKRGLVLDLQPILKLPDSVGRANDENPPKLTRLTLQWPVTVSPNHATLTLIDKQKVEASKTVLYHPEQRVIEWRDVPFQSPKQQSARTGFFLYKVPLMRLALEQPGELYPQTVDSEQHEAGGPPTMLKGRVEIKIPRTFSGLQIEFFDATGKKTDPKKEAPIEFQSQITVDFTLALENLFERRIHSPYQQLYFEGVVLDEMRLNDVEMVLAHHGFETRTRSFTGQRSKNRRYLVAAYRRRELEDIRLWLLLDGKGSQTVRYKTIPGDHMYTTALETGHMTIHMRGEVVGERGYLLDLMSEVHKTLKEQFHYMSVVE